MGTKDYWLGIRNDKGEMLRSHYWGEYSNSVGLLYAGTRIGLQEAFNDANKNNGKVVLITMAGEIEIFEKDFL
jgi:hypothetical protein